MLADSNGRRVLAWLVATCVVAVTMYVATDASLLARRRRHQLREALQEANSVLHPPHQPRAPREQLHFVVGYCALSAPSYGRRMPPLAVSRSFVEAFASRIFPHAKTTLKPLYVSPEDLPPDVDPDSPRGLEMVGLVGTHIRFCDLGKGTRLAKHMTQLHPNLRYDNAPMPPHLASMWSADERVYYPPAVSLVRNVSQSHLGKAPHQNPPIGPLLLRHAYEAWYDGTHQGIGAQLETKRDALPQTSVTWYLPNAVMHTIKVFGGDFKRVFSRTLSEPAWDAAHERESKKHFMVMLNSNCGDVVSPGDAEFERWGRYTMIRELFTYAAFSVTQKPVHNLGRCPLGDLSLIHI